MAKIKSTEEIILKTLLRLAKDVDAIKRILFNGLAQKVDALWAWKQEYPTRCNFLVWLEAHPEMKKKLKIAMNKNKRHMGILE